MKFLEIFKDTTSDRVGAVVARTDLINVLEPAVAQKVFEDLSEKIVGALFEEMYPEIEKRLKGKLPEIVEGFTDIVLTKIRVKVYGKEEE